MTEPRTYPAGATCMVDTVQPDLDAARRFYNGLFGWETTEAAADDGSGARLLATVDGRDVAVLVRDRSAAATWNTSIAVDDADATAEAVVRGGGRIVDQPADVGSDGRVATCVDPAGARFRLWQARRWLGAQHVNLPGGWVFSELRTPDRGAAMAFYRPVFGWKEVDLDHDGTAMLQLPGYGDHLAATVLPDIHERQEMVPEGFADVTAMLVDAPVDAAPRWHVSFGVTDRDAAMVTAEGLGATILSTTETMWTREAEVRDPQGAEFTISQFTPPDDW